MAVLYCRRVSTLMARSSTNRNVTMVEQRAFRSAMAVKAKKRPPPPEPLSADVKAALAAHVQVLRDRHSQAAAVLAGSMTKAEIEGTSITQGQKSAPKYLRSYGKLVEERERSNSQVEEFDSHHEDVETVVNKAANDNAAERTRKTAERMWAESGMTFEMKKAEIAYEMEACEANDRKELVNEWKDLRKQNTDTVGTNASVDEQQFLETGTYTNDIFSLQAFQGKRPPPTPETLLFATFVDQQDVEKNTFMNKYFVSRYKAALHGLGRNLSAGLFAFLDTLNSLIRGISVNSRVDSLNLDAFWRDLPKLPFGSFYFLFPFSRVFDKFMLTKFPNMLPTSMLTRSMYQIRMKGIEKRRLAAAPKILSMIAKDLKPLSQKAEKDPYLHAFVDFLENTSSKKVKVDASKNVDPNLHALMGEEGSFEMTSFNMLFLVTAVEKYNLLDKLSASTMKAIVKYLDTGFLAGHFSNPRHAIFAWGSMVLRDDASMCKADSIQLLELLEARDFRGYVPVKSMKDKDAGKALTVPGGLQDNEAVTEAFSQIGEHLKDSSDAFITLFKDSDKSNPLAGRLETEMSDEELIKNVEGIEQYAFLMFTRALCDAAERTNAKATLH